MPRQWASSSHRRISKVSQRHTLGRQQQQRAVEGASDERTLTVVLLRVLMRRVHVPAAIIDRTAEFVRRVGPQFEGEIMQRNKCVHDTDRQLRAARRPPPAACDRADIVL